MKCCVLTQILAPNMTSCLSHMLKHSSKVVESVRPIYFSSLRQAMGSAVAMAERAEDDTNIKTLLSFFLFKPSPDVCSAIYMFRWSFKIKVIQN